MEQPNLDYINQLSAGNDAFKLKMITIIKAELPLEIEAYQSNISQNNFKLAAECVHKLKHKISILGLEKSYYIAEQFEDNLKDNSFTLQENFEHVLSVMQDFADRL
jgi:HPt (histidine-containing phosphotransfer) domain-containing protein